MLLELKRNKQGVRLGLQQIIRSDPHSGGSVLSFYTHEYKNKRTYANTRFFRQTDGETVRLLSQFVCYSPEIIPLSAENVNI